MANIELQEGKIYHIAYGEQVQLVARYKKEDACNYYLFDYLHYWQGYEKFYHNAAYCCQAGITEIREATQAEKMALVRFEIEKNCI